MRAGNGSGACVAHTWQEQMKQRMKMVAKTARDGLKIQQLGSIRIPARSFPDLGGKK
jgi:hypothetical protein